MRCEVEARTLARALREAAHRIEHLERQDCEVTAVDVEGRRVVLTYAETRNSAPRC